MDARLAVVPDRPLLTIGVVGGALGAKGSFLLEDPWTTAQHLGDPAWLLSGRSIVGGLLGAWWSVELGKWWMGVTVATGDAYVRSIGYGLALGRVGCFLSGVSDGTHGVPTDLPWGMDLGDGVARHPTAMYEILMLLGLVPVVSRLRLPAEGDRFKVFLISYLLWRVAIESIKTQPFVFSGLSGIQVQCLLGLVVYAVVLAPRVFRRSSQVA
jgi:phosphatidylglycerol---prolipoprotein diacylglyceryl transferase